MSAQKILKIAQELSSGVDALEFEVPVTHRYNPLSYAWDAHAEYISRYGVGTKEALLIGMNPGPFGMAQTGVPFGDVALVRDWLGIEAPVGRPEEEHPKRPIQGFSCPRGEVSGQRLWGWARERFQTPERFFARFFVWNYCPLCFMGESGKNITPDKLPRAEREQLFAVCDRALQQLVEVCSPRLVIGIGAFARDRAKIALIEQNADIGTILHPSPASPAANRGWSTQAEKQLRSMNVEL